MIKEIINRVNLILCSDVESLMNGLELEIKNQKLDYITYKSNIDEKTLTTLDVADIVHNTKMMRSDKCYILINKNIRNINIQNSLLKTLEESNQNYIFVIFVPSINHLLQTLLSRSIVINKLSIKNEFSEAKKKLIMSKNLDGLTKILYLEDKHTRSLLSDKQVKDFVNVV